MSKAKQIGTAGETILVKVCQRNGFPLAHRRALKGNLDEGDVFLDAEGKIIFEMKSGAAAKTASDNQVLAWLEETEKERRSAGADIGVLVLQRAGYGEKRAESWYAVLCWRDWCLLTGSPLSVYFVTNNPGNSFGDPPVRVHLETVLQLVQQLNK